ncbi:unnamed protein product [Pleuronectes platessa]|uniref:Uncharacterized protein n=1 Tax=Pleuronectes platessa TaxID=8262 RepID=A0A9N7V8B1_PLEPL|nr:unnamed protein product [Pleuronectes platessa]
MQRKANHGSVIHCTQAVAEKSRTEANPVNSKPLCCKQDSKRSSDRSANYVFALFTANKSAVSVPPHSNHCGHLEREGSTLGTFVANSLSGTALTLRHVKLSGLAATRVFFLLSHTALSVPAYQSRRHSLSPAGLGGAKSLFT